LGGEILPFFLRRKLMNTIESLYDKMNEEKEEDGLMKMYVYFDGDKRIVLFSENRKKAAEDLKKEIAGFEDSQLSENSIYKDTLYRLN
jgi:hypothetical protein